jgi:hypothetical protein
MITSLGQRLDDGVEGGAQDEGNRQVQQVAAE